MNGAIIAFDPCHACESHDMCSRCELTLRRDGTLRTDKWISVEERLPHVSDEVLCYIKEYDSIDIYYYTGTDEWDNDRYCGSTKYIGVTHWMPLPEPPKMKG